MLTAGRDGGLQSLEVMGMLSIRIADEAFGRIKLAFEVIELNGEPSPVGGGTSPG